MNSLALNAAKRNGLRESQPLIAETWISSELGHREAAQLDNNRKSNHGGTKAVLYQDIVRPVD